MFQNRYEWWIGLRYLRAKRSQYFISVITLLSMGGIALGVAALIVVLAVMTGFKEELQQQILGVTSHIVIQSYAGQMSEYQDVIAQSSTIPGVKAVAPFILGQTMLALQGKAVGVMVRGIDPKQEKQVSALEKNMLRGGFTGINEYGIIVGARLAANLRVNVGDFVTMMSPSGNVTVAGTIPRMKRFRVIGVFDSGMYEYDSTLAYIHLTNAQTFFRYGNTVTGIEVRTDNPEQADQVRERLQTQLMDGYWIRDWMQMNRNFFRALKMEKITMFVILFLVVVVAAFNIISSLIMVVMDKGRDIAILKTMGATAQGIMTIFIINGGVIGILGTGVGLTLGLSLAFNLETTLGAIERLFDIQILSGDVYFIDHLPAKVLPNDVGWVTAISLLISLLATIYPAWRAARVDPVETLRYE